MWKRTLVTIMLVGLAGLSGYLWYQLSTTKEKLIDAVIELNYVKSQLKLTQGQLTTTERKLNVTEEKLATTEAQLDMTTKELTTTKSSFEMVKYENSQMVNKYTSFKSQIDIHLADTPEDKQSFITPDNSAISAKVQEITGGYSEDVNEYWRDWGQLYRWIVDNIRYSYDSYLPVLPHNLSGELGWSKDYWRMPEETLEDKTGDCEDMAVLLASFLLNYNEPNYRVWLLEIRISIPEEKGHLAVAFPVQGGRLTILDPAGNYYTGYQYGTLGSDIASIAVSNWLAHWQEDMPGAEIVAAFSESSYNEFYNTGEFLTWLEE